MACPAHSSKSLLATKQASLPEELNKLSSGNKSLTWRLSNYVTKALPRRRRRTESARSTTSALSSSVDPFDSEKNSQSSSQHLGEDVSDSSSSTLYPDAPDGGYGWVVVFAAFLCHLIADGIGFSFGVFFNEWVTYYQDTKARIGVIASIFYAIPLLASPIASAAVEQYDCRYTTMFGGFVAFGGFFLSQWAPSVNVLYVTFGCIAGFGLAFIYNAPIVAVTYYFEDKRALATGMTVSGSGMGTFIFAPLLEFLIEQYEWRGAMLILSGISLNLVICGALIRDLEWPEDSLDYKRAKFLKTLDVNSAASRKMASKEASLAEISAFMSGSPVPPAVAYVKGTGGSLIEVPTYLREQSGPPLLTSEAMRGTKSFSVMNSRRRKASGRAAETNLEETGGHSSSDVKTSSCPGTLCNLVSTAEQELKWELGEEGAVQSRNRPYDHSARFANSEPDLRPDAPLVAKVRIEVENETSLKPSDENTNVNKGQVDMPQEPTLVVKEKLPTTPGMLALSRHHFHAPLLPRYSSVSARVLSAPELRARRRKKRRPLVVRFRKFWREAGETLREDLSLLKSIPFLIFCLHSFILYSFYDVLYVCLPDFAVVHGVSESKASFLISLIGILNMIGMLIFGVLGDQKSFLKASYMYAPSIVICGLACGVVPWLGSGSKHAYVGFCVISGIFGFFISANYTLSSVIILEIFSIREFVFAYGIVNMLAGFGNLLGPALAGYLFDVSGNYTLTFVIGGVGIAISGALVLLIPICMNKQTRKEEEVTDQSESRDCEESISGDASRFFVASTNDNIQLSRKPKSVVSGHNNLMTDHCSVEDKTQLLVA